jgi:hypothetical protein
MKYNYKTAFRTNLSSNSEGSIMDHLSKDRVFKKDDNIRGLKKNINVAKYFD